MPIILAGFAIPFFAFCAAVILVGLSQTHTSQHGSSGIRGYIDLFIRSGPLAQLFGLAKKASRAAISHFAAAQLRQLARWLLAMGTLSAGVLTGNPHALEALEQAIRRVWHWGDPRARAKAQTAHRQAVHAQHTATHANVHARSVGHALDRYKARTNARVHHLSHAVDVAIPQDMARIRARNRALEREQAKQGGAIRSLEDGAADTWDWIRTHPLSGVTALFAGAVAIALSRIGWGVLRCRDWQRLGRSLKCSDANILRDLLGLVTGILAAEVGLVEFIRAAQAVETEAVDALHTFIRT